MIAEAHHLVGDVREVGGSVGHVRAVIRIRLEKFVPQQNSVLVRHVVEIWIGALAHPVADDVQAGESVHVKLRVEPLARDALHGFVEPPIAAAGHNFHAVYRKRQIVGAGNFVFDFADAELLHGGVG